MYDLKSSKNVDVSRNLKLETKKAVAANLPLYERVNIAQWRVHLDWWMYDVIWIYYAILQ